VSLTDALRRIELEIGARYPASFHARVDEFVALAATAQFQRSFPATKILLDAAEVRSARKNVGRRLVPFMRSAAEQPDIYAFESSNEGAEPKVVVWCVHTTVHEWTDFTQFLSWVREFCEKQCTSK